jgi:hypothetical protein
MVSRRLGSVGPKKGITYLPGRDAVPPFTDAVEKVGDLRRRRLLL